MNYVDTSLVTVAMDTTTRARSKKAAAMLASAREKVVSELFLVELSAAISRKPELISALPVEDTQPSTILLAYLVHLMSKYELKLLSPSNELVATPLGRVGAESGFSIALSSDLKLRSLDLLHVAYLMSLKNRGFGIESFLTSNPDFSKAEKFLEDNGVKLILLKP
jgi:glycerol-3-phosphate cytidylyltransferase-like family protein